MSEPAKPPDQSSKPDKKDKDALIFTPISIARARHASTHGPSVVDKTEQKTDTKKEQSIKQPKAASASMPSSVTASNLLNSPNNLFNLIPSQHRFCGRWHFGRDAGGRLDAMGQWLK